MAQDPMIYQKLIDSIAPSIWQLDEVKKGVLCQLFGAGSKVKTPPQPGLLLLKIFLLMPCKQVHDCA